MASNPNNPLAHLWGSFQAAVNDPEVRAQPGGIQQYVWQSIRNDFISRGESLPSGSFQAVNQLLSVAGQQRQASLNLQRAIDNFERTGRDSVILAGEHTAPDIDSRPFNQQPLGPDWRVRIEYSVLIEGELVFLRGTWDPGLARPESISSLSSGAEEAAAVFAADYGYEFEGGATVLGITTV